MPNKLQTWHIPRSDKRNRCAECLLVIRKNQAKKRGNGRGVLRFVDYHLMCYNKKK